MLHLFKDFLKAQEYLLLRYPPLRLREPTGPAILPIVFKGVSNAEHEVIEAALCLHHKRYVHQQHMIFEMLTLPALMYL